MKYSSFSLLLVTMGMGLLFACVSSMWDHTWSGLVFGAYIALLVAVAKNTSSNDEPLV